MTDDDRTADGSTFERRRFLQFLGAGAGVSGFGRVASADGEITIEDSQALSEAEADRQFQMAQDTQHATDVINFVSEGDLELVSENALADRIVTDDESLNRTDPVIAAAPFLPPDDSHQFGMYWELLYEDDDGNRVPAGGVATTVELVDGQHYLRIYGTDGEPKIVEEHQVDKDASTSGTLVDRDVSTSASLVQCEDCVWLADLLCNYALWMPVYDICMWICPFFDSQSDCELSCEILAEVISSWICFWNDDWEVCERADIC